MVAPIPSEESAAMSVVFLPRFLGARPMALFPFGALALSGVLGLCWCHIRQRREAGPDRIALRAPSKHFSLLRLARWLPNSFFVGPTQLAYSSAHGRDRNPHALLSVPQFAALLQGR